MSDRSGYTLRMFRVEPELPFDPGRFGWQATHPISTGRWGGSSSSIGSGGGGANSYHGNANGRRQTVPLDYDMGTASERQGLMMTVRDGSHSGTNLLKPPRDPVSSRWTWLSICALVSISVLWFTLITTIYVMYSRVSSSLAAAKSSATPYMGEAINHTMSILEHVDNSAVGASDMMQGAKTISDRAVPAIQLAINQTAAMIARLERLARNPVLQLSLQQGVPPGTG